MMLAKSGLGQTEKSGRATGKLALPSITDMASQARQVRNGPTAEVAALLNQLIRAGEQSQ
jgi:hypothetical protein